MDKSLIKQTGMCLGKALNHLADIISFTSSIGEKKPSAILRFQTALQEVQHELQGRDSLDEAAAKEYWEKLDAIAREMMRQIIALGQGRNSNLHRSYDQVQQAMAKLSCLSLTAR
ncbi:hypothetical protein JNK13_00725 [bacterium]|nr:hypothetical protein [bacterium]